jgi:hypothetical protein
MDSTRFDALARIFASRRPRRAALPLLAVLGLGLVDAGGVGTAKKKDEKAIRICVCADANPSTCKTQKRDKSKAKKTLRRNACAYKGRCTGVSGCAAFGCDPRNPTGSCQAGQICNPQAICVAGCIGTNGSQANCPVGQICVIGAGQTTGQCRTGPVCTPVCNPNQVCCPPGTLKAGKCQGDENACRTP